MHCQCFVSLCTFICCRTSRYTHSSESLFLACTWYRANVNKFEALVSEEPWGVDKRQRMREVREYQRREHERWMKDVLGLERDFRSVRAPRTDQSDDAPRERREREREREGDRERDHRERRRDSWSKDGGNISCQDAHISFVHMFKWCEQTDLPSSP